MWALVYDVIGCDCTCMSKTVQLLYKICGVITQIWDKGEEHNKKFMMLE